MNQKLDNKTKRCWAEISLDSISGNYKAIRDKLPRGCRFMGIVKADAYGHGAASVARRLQDEKADYLGVSCIDEAVSLRENGIKLPILILGHTPAAYVDELLRYNLTQTLVSTQAASDYSGELKKRGKRLRCHLKADTGMNRFGFWGNRREDELLDTLYDENLIIEGIFSHFASAGEDTRFTRRQFDDFYSLCHNLERRSGMKLEIKHCANSGAVLNYDWACLDMVRPGIALYGHDPNGSTGNYGLSPAMSFKTRICQIKQVERGETVSYGRTWKAEKRTTIAVLPAGYADGLFRGLSNKAGFLIKGKRAPLLGRICMDICMADVSEIPEASQDDPVLIFGKDEFGIIPVEEHALAAGTVAYELLCAVSSRVHRVYV